MQFIFLKFFKIFFLTYEFLILIISFSEIREYKYENFQFTGCMPIKMLHLEQEACFKRCDKDTIFQFLALHFEMKAVFQIELI